MGEFSALAQNLPRIVTSSQKFRNSSHRLYILSSSVENQVLGILKTGEKRLFMHDNQGVCTELEPLCILDFYIHDSMQRRGYGKKLFDHML
ncbi:alpha-tubulin N-acetyltransferase 1, partial [Paragonimus westermani]